MHLHRKCSVPISSLVTYLIKEPPLGEATLQESEPIERGPRAVNGEGGRVPLPPAARSLGRPVVAAFSHD